MGWNLVTNIQSDTDNGVLCSVTPIDCYAGAAPAMRTDSSITFSRKQRI